MEMETAASKRSSSGCDLSPVAEPPVVD